ncbi:hypothetical protein J0H58_26195 [bacterium]|nr:hypothetical protein [bacterium]
MRTIVMIVVVGLTAGCGGEKPAGRSDPPPLSRGEAEAKDVFRAANEFLVAAKAGDWEKAGAVSEVPFLVGDWAAPRPVGDRAALAAQLKQNAEGLFGEDGSFEPRAQQATPLRAGNPPTLVAREVTDNWPATLARWAAVTGPDVHLTATGDTLNSAPVRLLVRVRGGKAAVVGMVRVPSVPLNVDAP